MIVASLLFGISASLDSLLVGISYGVRGTRIRLWQNLAISLVTLLGTCLSAGLGHRLAGILPGVVSAYAGSLVLVLLGLYYIIKWLGVRRQRPKLHPRNHAGPETSPLMSASRKEDEPSSPADRMLCLPEIFSLSLVLSLNNLSAGFSASLAGLPLAGAAVSTFVCSILFLSSGNHLGGSPLLQMDGKAADPLSGALLMGLGIVQLFF